jgi:hypothetical protein
MEHKLAIDVTVSGSPKSRYMLPNGDIKHFTGKSGGYSVWDAAEPRTFKLNALAVEKFQKQTYPVVDVSAKKKDISRLKEFWYSGWDANKIYDIAVKTVGEKTVTMVKTVSGDVYYVDEDVSVFEDALNGITGN